LDVRDPQAKVIVADSRYEDHQFPGIFEHLQRTFGLIRIHSNRVLYEEPQKKASGSRGAPRKHAKPFKLNKAHRQADQSETFQLGKQTVRVSLWQKLHFKKLATLIDSLVQVEFLKEDGMPRYKRPMRLFWTGPQSVALSDSAVFSLLKWAHFRLQKRHKTCLPPVHDRYLLFLLRFDFVSHTVGRHFANLNSRYNCGYVSLA
jgi:hypothetical protein